MSRYLDKFVQTHTKKDAAAQAAANAEIAIDEIDLALSNAQYQLKQAERNLSNATKSRDNALMDEKFSAGTISNWLSKDTVLANAQQDVEDCKATITKLEALKAEFTEE